MSNDHRTREMQAAGDASPECEALVDARLADYLDDSPDPALVAEVNAHVRSCARCAALVGDLTGITAAARSLPPLIPARDLWSGIAGRIATPVTAPTGAASTTVVSIESAPSRRRRGLPAHWRSLGAAAAALVLITAGVTFTVTRATIEGGADHGAAGAAVAAADATTPPKGGVTTGPKAPPGELATAAGATSGNGSDAADDAGEARTTSTTGQSGATLAAERGSSSSRRVAAAVAAKTTYDREIDALRRIVRERRSQLDPATLAVLERNIAVIDEAIAQSRAALTRDPRSRFLDDQLNSALDKKLDLLRTAALLPART